MFHNYFFLKRLASELNDRLTGLKLLECFSQNKDELILAFGSKNDECYIRANLDPNVSLLGFPEEFARAGKNSVDLFSSLLDKEVSEVTVFSYERSFQIHFGTASLIFKMHARRGNILLTEDNEVVEIFRKKLTQDMEVIPGELHQNIEISKEAFEINCSF